MKIGSVRSDAVVLPGNVVTKRARTLSIRETLETFGSSVISSVIALAKVATVGNSRKSTKRQCLINCHNLKELASASISNQAKKDFGDSLL
ncbi:MAG: hypothetical protein ACREMY_11515, partial [bacterium]